VKESRTSPNLTGLRRRENALLCLFQQRYGGFMTTGIPAPPNNDYVVDESRETLRGVLVKSVVVFLIAYSVLFLGMSLQPNGLDEGLILTGAMRVAAGQIPHRDFFTLYGPAQFYILAGLFKVFGQFILVERLLDFFVKALVVTAVYAIALSYCRARIAAGIAILTGFWLLGLNGSGSTIIPVSLLNLIASILIVPIFSRSLSTMRMLAAGAVAGMATLFRYDTGVALLGIHACVVTIAICFRFKGTSNRLRAFVSAFWPYLLGFAILTLPPALYYLSVAPLAPLIHDMIVYPSKYYHRARNLPFPGIYWKGLENFEIYLPIAVAGISLYVPAAHRLGARVKGAFRSPSTSEEQNWLGFLVTFGLLTLVMYLKGFVRVSMAQMYLSIVPSFLLIAVLFQHRSTLPRLVRISAMCFVWLSVLATTWAILHTAKALYVQRAFLPEGIWSSARGTLSKTQTTWCKFTNPLIRGICFSPPDNRIQTIEFINSHTIPGQTLYEGVTNHDRIFANDSLIYFASQRLPATKWSELDPDLETRYDIQKQMVHELEVNAPPYIVLDSEFQSMREPNDSSKSSGVTLLDEYIHNRYQHVETFGDMSIWQRQ
jgi:hypothetical protein